jgi:hypothetical protein
MPLRALDGSARICPCRRKPGGVGLTAAAHQNRDEAERPGSAPRLEEAEGGFPFAASSPGQQQREQRVQE